MGTDDENEDEEMLILEEASDGETCIVDGEALVIKISLSVQRENIFHMRYHMNNKVYHY